MRPGAGARWGSGGGGRGGGGELEEQRGLFDAELAEDLLVAGGELGPLAACAGGAGERAEV